MSNLRLPSPNQMIHGKRRGEWVKDAARALISSMDPALLWKVVHVGGILKFMPMARREFATREPGIDFTTEEMRWIFNFLAEHLDGLEKTDKARRSINHAAKDFEVDDKGDGRIVTDSASRGTKVH